jgi:hypothetical protein
MSKLESNSGVKEDMRSFPMLSNLEDLSNVPFDDRHKLDLYQLLDNLMGKKCFIKA